MIWNTRKSKQMETEEKKTIKNRALDYRRNSQADKIHLNLKNKFWINQKKLRHEALFCKRDLTAIKEKDLKIQESKQTVSCKS
jgi:hypothetical protein